MKAEPTAQTFRVRIVGQKRQATIPSEMMTLLRLEPGDEIEFTIVNHGIAAAAPRTSIRLDLFPEPIVDFIRKSQEEVTRGEFVEMSLDDFRAKLVRHCGPPQSQLNQSTSVVQEESLESFVKSS